MDEMISNVDKLKFLVRIAADKTAECHRFALLHCHCRLFQLHQKQGNCADPFGFDRSAIHVQRMGRACGSRGSFTTVAVVHLSGLADRPALSSSVWHRHR